MGAVDKALWFIESHYAQDINLDDIAKIAGVSRFHLSRAFPLAMGSSISTYVRGRRLSQAARQLAQGAPDILAVAIEAGYSSHEAFTRAFRDQFNCTPEMVRAQRNVDNLTLVEPIKMTETLINNLAEPRFETGRAMKLAGLTERYNCESSAAIPSLWQRFGAYIGNIPGQIGKCAYGAKYVNDGDGDNGYFNYMSAWEVAANAPEIPELHYIEIPIQTYLVFTHSEHISTIRQTCITIWDKYLPQSNYKASKGTEFELYDEKFDSVTGLAGLELWIPIQA
ncbi:AraC family transcriptional regulator [soil metagenome]